MQKTPAPCKKPFLKENEKNHQERSFWVVLVKKGNMWRFYSCARIFLNVDLMKLKPTDLPKICLSTPFAISLSLGVGCKKRGGGKEGNNSLTTHYLSQHINSQSSALNPIQLKEGYYLPNPPFHPTKNGFIWNTKTYCYIKYHGLIHVKEEGRTGFSVGWQGCTEERPFQPEENFFLPNCLSVKLLFTER